MVVRRRISFQARYGEVALEFDLPAYTTVKQLRQQVAMLTGTREESLRLAGLSEHEFSLEVGAPLLLVPVSYVQ